MTRLPVHLAVESLAACVRLYPALFAAQPIVIESDYAHSKKSSIEDPQRVLRQTFLTTGESTVCAREGAQIGPRRAAKSACCTPARRCPESSGEAAP